MNDNEAERGKTARRKIRKKDLLAAPNKKLNNAAKRALSEAAARRRAFDPFSARSKDCPFGSLEPTRYGDWEAAGKCSDF